MNCSRCSGPPACPNRVRQYVLALPGGSSARFDAAYPELALGFEADGDAYHKGLLDQMRDEARDEACRRLGWTVRRYSHRRHPVSGRQASPRR